MRTIQIQLEGCVREIVKPGNRPLAPVVKGAKDALNKLANEGNLVILVTSAPWSEQNTTINWLMQHSIRYTLLLMGQPETDEVIQTVDWEDYFLTRDGKYDAIALKEVRRATKLFIEPHTLSGRTLELGPANPQTVPFPDYLYKLNYKGTLEFLNSEDEFYQTNSVYDNIVALNVLEHTVYLSGFANKCMALLKPEGKVYVLTPFNLRFHGPKPDMWRITDTGLRYLFRDYVELQMTYYGPETKPYAIGAVFQK